MQFEKHLSHSYSIPIVYNQLKPVKTSINQIRRKSPMSYQNEVGIHLFNECTYESNQECPKTITCKQRIENEQEQINKWERLKEKTGQISRF